MLPFQNNDQKDLLECIESITEKDEIVIPIDAADQLRQVLKDDRFSGELPLLIKATLLWILPVDRLLAANLHVDNPLKEKTEKTFLTPSELYPGLGICLRQLSALKNAFERVDHDMSGYQTTIVNLENYYKKALKYLTENEPPYEPRAIIQGVGFPARYLTLEATRALFSRKDGEFEQKSDLGGTHSHVVNRYAEVYFKLLFEMRIREPKESQQYYGAPGIEYAIYSLNKHLFGQGSAFSTLLHVTLCETTLPVLATKTVGNSTLGALDAALLEKLSEDNVSAQIIHSILVRPYDERLDNIILRDESGEVMLVKIDQDLGFANSVYCLEQKPSNHLIGVRTFLYFLPHMSHLVPQSIRLKFDFLCPEIFLLEWLLDCAKQNQEYQVLKDKQLLSEKEWEALKLPIRFVPGTVERLYNDLKQLKIVLQNEEATHWDLLERVGPVVKAYYKKLFDFNDPKSNTKAKSLDQRITASISQCKSWIKTCISEEYCLSLEDERVLPSNEFNLTNNMETEYSFLERTQTLSKAVSSLLDRIDLNSLNPDEQDIIQKHLLSFRGFGIEPLEKQPSKAYIEQKAPSTTAPNDALFVSKNLKECEELLHQTDEYQKIPSTKQPQLQ